MVGAASASARSSESAVTRLTFTPLAISTSNIVTVGPGIQFTTRAMMSNVANVCSMSPAVWRSSFSEALCVGGGLGRAARARKAAGARSPPVRAVPPRSGSGAWASRARGRVPPRLGAAVARRRGVVLEALRRPRSPGAAPSCRARRRLDRRHAGSASSSDRLARRQSTQALEHLGDRESGEHEAHEHERAGDDVRDRGAEERAEHPRERAADVAARWRSTVAWSHCAARVVADREDAEDRNEHQAEPDAHADLVDAKRREEERDRPQQDRRTGSHRRRAEPEPQDASRSRGAPRRPSR